MLKLRTLRFALLATTLAIVINLALSAVTFAHDKRWRRLSQTRQVFRV